jgi:hypothetical protein
MFGGKSLPKDQWSWYTDASGRRYLAVTKKMKRHAVKKAKLTPIIDVKSREL